MAFSAGSTGGYGGFFRTGSSKGSAIEVIHNSLNQSRGTAYNTERGSIVWIENLMLAKAIASIWSSNKALTNNFDPNHMFAFIDRWYSILNITPTSNETIIQKQAKISAHFQLFSKPPTPQNVEDLLRLIVPEIFIDVEYNNPLNNQGSFPGGLTVPGGVTLGDGPFMSYLNQINIRIWQPRDHNNHLLMTNAEFQDQQNLYSSFLNNYLPAYVGFKKKRFFYQAPGTITMAAGSNAVVGVGTNFLSILSVNDRFETVDDLGNVRTYTVSSISDDEHMTVINSLTYNNTNGYYRIIGCFILDYPQNLDNMVLC